MPGKLILAGEHAVVYGRPALVAALGLRLTATVEICPGNGVELDLPEIGLRLATTWDAVRSYALDVRERWNGFTSSPTPGGFQALRGDDPAHLVKVALGEGAHHLESMLGTEVVGIRLGVESAIPLGSGFGSSAAMALGVLSALLAAHGANPTPVELERLALDVERRQHGTPSGVDGAAALFGGLLWARKRADGGLEAERLTATSPLLSHFRVYHTGVPPEATGAVVAAVRRKHDESPEEVEATLDRIERATARLRAVLTESAESEPGLDAGREVDGSLRECERSLEELGVVPSPVRDLVRQIEGHGGAAKISGAGSLAGPGGGSLLVFHPDCDAPSRWSFLSPYPWYAVPLGAVGLRRETGT